MSLWNLPRGHSGWGTSTREPAVQQMAELMPDVSMCSTRTRHWVREEAVASGLVAEVGVGDIAQSWGYTERAGGTGSRE